MTDVSDVMLSRASQQLRECRNRLKVAIIHLYRAPSGSRPRDWTPEISILQGMRLGLKNMSLSIDGYVKAKQMGVTDDE